MVRALVLALVLAVLPASPVVADAGPWGWPLAGPQEVSRPFAPPASRYGAGHRGVALPAAAGAPVRAAAAGRVTYAGRLAGRGVVVVTHGALRTTYEPVTASVRVGDAVALGAVVGALEAGHAGCPVQACLHWGLRRGQEYLDPVRLVERGPVRLLPVPPAGPGSLRAPAPGAAALEPGPAPVVPAPVAPSPAPSVADPAATPEPAWSLRAAEAPLGAAAVVALVLGIALLARPRSGPPDPVSGGLAATAAPPPDEPVGEPGLLLDLDAARARRQAAS